MEKQKSYVDYVNEYLGSKDLLENVQPYTRDKITAYYVKAANDFKNKKALENAKNDKMQAHNEALVAHERARKYVNALSKHYGIAGTGYGESKMIALYSNLAKDRSEANSKYNERINEITTDMVNDELEFSKLYNSAVDKQAKELDNSDTLVIDYLFSILSEEELNNMPDIIFNNDYFQKLFNEKFINSPFVD